MHGTHDRSFIIQAVFSPDSQALAISVTVGAILIFGIVLLISFVLAQRLKDEIAFKGAILESVLDCVIIINQYGEIIECNPAITRTFGYSREEIIGQRMEKKLLVHSSLKSADTSFSFTAIEGKMLCDQRLEVMGVRQDGLEFPLELTVTKIEKDGLPLFTVYARDITLVKQSEETIRQMAYQDTLTGLPNRRYFNETLRMSLKKAEMDRTEVAVIFLDLDHFKRINDTMGHAFGDGLLKSVAGRLQLCLGMEHVVARNGGDEFTIILNNTSVQEAKKTADRIIDSFTRPFKLDGQEVQITTSMGVAMFPRDALEQETLLKNADVAMYETKKRGRNGFSFYE